MDDPQRKELFSRSIIGVLVLIVFAVIWFAIAGRATWWQGWAFLLITFFYLIALLWRLLKVNPELLKERNLPADQAEPWDQVVMRIYTVFLVIVWIVSALDARRYFWSVVPWGFQLAGWVLLVASGAIIWHVMMTNAYLSSWARIQEDRGQVVIQEGLYQYIRHPMYLGIIMSFLGIPLLLASWWTMVPCLFNIGLFVYRTYREDMMLVDGLAGYVEYTQKVRYRLVPGIW